MERVKGQVRETDPGYLEAALCPPTPRHRRRAEERGEETEHTVQPRRGGGQAPLYGALLPLLLPLLPLSLPTCMPMGRWHWSLELPRASGEPWWRNFYTREPM